jgi:hypothetical protein
MYYAARIHPYKAFTPTLSRVYSPDHAVTRLLAPRIPILYTNGSIWKDECKMASIGAPPGVIAEGDAPGRPKAQLSAVLENQLKP